MFYQAYKLGKHNILIYDNVKNYNIITLKMVHKKNLSIKIIKRVCIIL